MRRTGIWAAMGAAIAVIAVAACSDDERTTSGAGASSSSSASSADASSSATSSGSGGAGTGGAGMGGAGMGGMGAGGMGAGGMGAGGMGMGGMGVGGMGMGGMGGMGGGGGQMSSFWSKAFEHVTTVTGAIGSDGVIFGGLVQGAADLGGGQLSPGSGIYIAKLDLNGNHVFSRSFNVSSQPGFIQLRGVAPDATGGAFFSGDYFGSLDLSSGTPTPLPCAGSPGSPRGFLAKASADGAVAWSKCFSDAFQQQFSALAPDGAGGVVLGGYAGGPIDLGGGPVGDTGQTEIFVARFDAAGQHLWSKAFQGETQDLERLAVDSGGGLAVSGTFSGAMDFGNGPKPVMGPTVFLARLDAAGNELWVRLDGPPAQLTPWRLAIDAAGNTYAASHFAGSVDFGAGPLASSGGVDLVVLKLDAAGGLLWLKTFGSLGDDWLRGVAVDAAGGLLLAGSFNGTIDFGSGPMTSVGGPNAFLVRLDPAGGALSSKRYGDGSADGLWVASSEPGGAALGGLFKGTIDLGNGPLMSGPMTSTFVARVAP